MSDAASIMDNISMREIRGAINRIDLLIRQLERAQNQQGSQLAKLAGDVMQVGQTVLTMQFWANQLSNSLENKHYLGAAIPVMSAITTGMGRGLQAAQETQKLGDKIKRGEIQFGTEADKQRFAFETALKQTLFFFVG